MCHIARLFRPSTSLSCPTSVLLSSKLGRSSTGGFWVVCRAAMVTMKPASLPVRHGPLHGVLEVVAAEASPAHPLLLVGEDRRPQEIPEVVVPGLSSRRTGGGSFVFNADIGQDYESTGNRRKHGRVGRNASEPEPTGTKTTRYPFPAGAPLPKKTGDIPYKRRRDASIVVELDNRGGRGAKSTRKGADKKCRPRAEGNEDRESESHKTPSNN